MSIRRESWLKLLQQLSSGQTTSQLAAETIQNLTKYGTYLVCYGVVLYPYCCTCRQEHTVRKFEADNGVQVRWTPEMEEYQEAMRVANASKQQKLKQEMLHSARERVFYLNTLVHHAGKYKHFMHSYV